MLEDGTSSQSGDNIDACRHTSIKKIESGTSMTAAAVIKPPDGGWGWVVCFACFMSHVLVDGLLYSFGVVFVDLLDYFKESRGETAIIMSLTHGMCFLVGPVVAIFMNKFGCRIVVCAGTFLSSGSLIVSIFAPNVRFLYFSLGVTLGIGYGMIYLPSIVCVTEYFEKKRALATGIAVSGAGIGTFIFSPLISILVKKYSWQGTLLIQAGIVLNCLACGLVYRPIKIAKPSDNEKIDDVSSTSAQQNVKLLSEECTPLSDQHNMLDNSKLDNKSSDCPELSTLYFHHDKSTSKNDNYPKGDENESNPKIIESTDKELTEMYKEEKNVPDGNHGDYKMEQEPDVHEKLFSEAENEENSKLSELTKSRSVLQYIKDSIPSLINVDIFTNAIYCMFLASTFFYTLGYYIPYMYLPDTAREAGVDDFKASLLIAIIGITNTIGRVIFGYISDMSCVNRLLLYSTALVICGVATCFGPLLLTFELLMIYSVVFGVFSGVTISLTSVLLADIVGVHNLADAFGANNFFAGIASFFGPPLAGRIYDITGDYKLSYISAGLAITLSGVMLYIVPCIDKSFLQRRKSV